MSRQLISSGSEFESKIAYSRAVFDSAFMSGSDTTEYDCTTMTISESVTEQLDQYLKNFKQVLEYAAIDLSGIFRRRYILSNKADFEPRWPAFQKHRG